MPIPMTLHDHIQLDAYEQRLMRSRFARSWAMSRAIGCALGCSILTIATAVAQIAGQL